MSAIRSQQAISRRHALASLVAVTHALIGLHCLGSVGEACVGGARPFLTTRRPPGEDMEHKPVSQRAMNPYRLPQHVIPMRYDLRLEPDLKAFTFSGEETVTLTINEATSEIVLNAVELQILDGVIEHDARCFPSCGHRAGRVHGALPVQISCGAATRGRGVSPCRSEGRSTTSFAGFIAACITILMGKNSRWRRPSSRRLTRAGHSPAGTSRTSRPCSRRPWQLSGPDGRLEHGCAVGTP